jgi:thiol-disulfide isomerase/thioredoxin
MQDRIARGMLIAALLASGCGNSATNESTGSVAKTETPPVEEPVAVETPPPDQGREPPFESAPPETPAATDVTQMDAPWEGVVEQIAAHKGKIVVVDLWATYCVPCRTSFPGLVALSKQDPENIVCISVSLDDPEDQEKRAEALQFLQEQQAEFTNLLCTTESDKLYDEILQIGGIPAVYVYGRDGAQSKLFTGPTPEGEDHTYEQHITPYVTELAAMK